MKSEDLIVPTVLLGGGYLLLREGQNAASSAGEFFQKYSPIYFGGNVYSPEAQLNPMQETLRNLDYWLNPLTYLYSENLLHKWGWF